ncbi:MAG TPA: hypothetical protein VF077_08975 [Nitrospiraceae bacterium]
MDRMQLAEALTTASKSLERSRQKVEAVGLLMEKYDFVATDGSSKQHAEACKQMAAELAIMNRKLRGMAP